jgi:hypothetical protein
MPLMSAMTKCFQRKTLHTGLLILGMLSIVLSGCRAFNREDTHATLQAENALYATEIADLEQIVAANRVAMVETVDASQRGLSVVNAVNQQLVATLQVIVTPTPELIVDQALGGDSIPADLGDRRWFVPTGIAASIRSADGCADLVQNRFTTSAAAVYATVRAFNLDQGTPMSVQWFREGVLQHEERWIVDRNYREVCVWFNIDSSVVTLTPGTWSARLFADGFQLESSLPFTIVSAGDEMPAGETMGG